MNTIDKKITFDQAIASLIETNPFQTLATFVFADDKPNQNNQALPFSEFERVAATAIGMPVKMRFTSDDVENHEGSIPIGVIQSMEIKTISDDHHQLVAKAALWNDEYPEEISWLKARFAEGTAPGISYEINYRDFDEIEKIRWIKETYTGAAAFVKNPAYGTRTALIALASQQDKTQLEEGIIALAQQLENNQSKGGTQMDEKEIEALKAERDTFKAEASSKQSEIEALTTKISELETNIAVKESEVAALQNAALLDTRIRKYTDAGFTFEAEAEKADKKKQIFSSLTDEQFEEYLSDLVSVKGTAKPAADPKDGLTAALAAVAAASGNLPKLDLPQDTDITSLKQGMKTLARPNSID